MKLRAVALAGLAVASASLLGGSTQAEPVDIPGSPYPHIELGIETGAVLWNGMDRDIVRPGGFLVYRVS